MLSELKISNFRLFDAWVHVRFRPITILIGRNSSGKSTVIKFLLMLQQSVMANDSQFPVANGAKINLGDFKDLKNSITNDQNLHFELSLSAPFGLGLQALPLILNRYSVPDENSLRLTLGAQVPYGSDRGGTFSYRLTQPDSETTHANYEAGLYEDYAFSSSAMLRKMDEIQTTISQVDDLSDLGPRRRSKLDDLLDDFLPKAELGMLLFNELNTASHLEPTRAEPTRVIATSRIPPNDVGSDGRYAVAHLHRIMTDDAETFEFVLPHIRNVTGIDSFEFTPHESGATRASAKNATTGAKVLIADFGFGVSQALPVLVQGALMKEHSTLMVEQPEAQLHPTAQLELGGYFADLWAKRKIGTIIETHSGNILLRLRRLIARGHLSHEDISVAYFTFDETNGNPVVKNLNVNDDGSMQAGLPMEFFGADVIEGLRLGARE